MDNETERSSYFVRITRKHSFSYSARDVEIYIDGNYKGKLGNGASMNTFLQSGMHTIAVEIGSKTIGFVSFSIEGGQNAVLSFSISASGNAKFEFYGSAVPIRDEFLPHNYTPHVRETNAANLYGCLWMILGAIVFIILICVLFPGFVNGFRIGFRLGFGQ